MIKLQTNANVLGYYQDDKLVSANLDDGSQVNGVALIGAEGLWSKIRNQLVGDGPPKVSGHTTYRLSLIHI